MTNSIHITSQSLLVAIQLGNYIGLLSLLGTVSLIAAGGAPRTNLGSKGMVSLQLRSYPQRLFFPLLDRCLAA
jgi:hypothetical protein